MSMETARAEVVVEGVAKAERTARTTRDDFIADPFFWLIVSVRKMCVELNRNHLLFQTFLYNKWTTCPLFLVGSGLGDGSLSGIYSRTHPLKMSVLLVTFVLLAQSRRPEKKNH